MNGYIDPWAGANQTTQTLSALGQQIDQDRRMKLQEGKSAQDAQMQALQMQGLQAQLADTAAKQGAIQQMYGAASPQDAYVKQMQAEKDKAEMNTFFGHVDNLKKAGASPQTITEWAKATIGQNPKYADMAQHISFIDDTGLEVTKPFKDGELPDPTHPGQFLPAGTYTVKGKRTGDPNNPIAFSGITPFVQKTDPAAHNVQEIPSPDGKTAQKFQYNPSTQRYDIPLGKPYAVKSQVPNINIKSGDDKPPKGYRWTADGNLEAIPGGPGDKKAGGKVLPAGQLEALADMKQLKDTVAEAGALVAKGAVKTGPIAGRSQSLGAMVGLANDDFVNVQQKLQSAQNIMLKLRSGAAVTDQEYARFLKEFPTPNDPPAVFTRKMNNAVKYASDLMDQKMSFYEEGGYRVPKQSATATRSQATKGGGRFQIIEVK